VPPAPWDWNPEGLFWVGAALVALGAALWKWAEARFWDWRDSRTLARRKREQRRRAQARRGEPPMTVEELDAALTRFREERR